MIRPPAINLARRPFRNNTAYYAVYSACLALLLAATTYNGWRFVAGGSELERLREDVSFASERYMKLHEEVEEMKRQINSLDLAVINTKSSFAEGLILSRFFSWSLLFDRLEELIPPEVKIQRIAPNISTKRIEITVAGMSRSPDAFLEFEGNLASSPFFSNVYPVREDQQEGQTELKFNLAMDYIPAGKDALAQPDAPPPGTASADGSAPPTAAATVILSPGGESPASPEAPGAGAAPGSLPGAAAADASSPPAASQPSIAGAAGLDQPPAPQPAAPQPQAKQAPAASRGGPALSVSDISQMTDEQFIEVFGYPEYMRARGKVKRPGKGAKAGKAGPATEAPAPPADPNGATP
jgi:Tfp pilus assembly protein PilN